MQLVFENGTATPSLSTHWALIGIDWAKSEKRLALPAQSDATGPDVYYYPIQPQHGDTARGWVANSVLWPSSFMSRHFHDAIMRWDWFAEVYWFIQEIEGRIFSFYFEGSEEALFQVINGEIPLEHCDPSLLWRIANRHEVLWSCSSPRCGWKGREDDSLEGLCPLCDGSEFREGNLYLR
jgi:hypothetical protein